MFVHKPRFSEDSKYWVGLFVIVLVTVAFWVGSSYLEAQAYQRITGKTVSTFDAMFLSLRVDGTPK